MRTIITYGTFDLLHYGHIRLLKRAKEECDFLIVGLFTDEFNNQKGKTSYYDYNTRKEMLEAIKYVDMVIPEYDWNQKIDDIKNYNVDVLTMCSDWEGSDKFSYLSEYCEVKFLSRTENISTSQIKKNLNI